MAILKHKGYKSADYTSCQQYYLFEHDEINHKPILDENGNLIPRKHVLTAAQNTTWEDWAVDCWKVNNKYNQNNNRGDVKSHEYVLSFDPRDGIDNGLTLEKTLEIGKSFAVGNFPGHQAVIAVHMKDDGNFDVHICINSTRMYDEEKLNFMEKSCDYEAGYKHRCTHERLVYLKEKAMDMCRENGLYQVDLLADRSDSYNKISDKEYSQAMRGQKKLDEENAEKIANGEPVTVTKYDTQKEELRQAIREVASYSTDFEDFKTKMMTDFGVEVTESRGKIGYIHPERNKPTRADKLGYGYSREAIEEQIYRQKGKAKDLEPEERKADFILKYGTWSAWRDNEYSEFERLSLLENEAADYVLKNSRDLHIAIKGLSEDDNMPVYSSEARQYIQRLDGSADALKDRPSADLRREYVDNLQVSGRFLANKIQAAEEIKQLNIEEGIRKSYEYRNLEMYGRETRAIFGNDYNELADMWVEWETKANIQKGWADYKAVSDKFWSVRAELLEHEQELAGLVSNEAWWAKQAYEDAYWFCMQTRDPLSALIGMIWMIIEAVRLIQAEREATLAALEVKRLQENTSDFYKFSQAYREDLVAGRVPHQKYLDAMTNLVSTFDEEYRQIQEWKYGKDTIEFLRANYLEMAKEYSQEQQGAYKRQDWKLKQMNDTIMYARKHELTLDNALDKIKAFGRELGNARKQAEAAEKKFEQMQGTANAAKDYADLIVFAKRHMEMPEGEERDRYYRENKESIDTFNYAKEILQKRGINTEDGVNAFFEEYKKATIDSQRAKKHEKKAKQNYIEACKFRDNMFKIYYRNGVYLSDFDQQKDRASGRTQTGGREQIEWRTVATEQAGRADSNRTAAGDERVGQSRAGEQSAQREFDRIQREIQGIERNVADFLRGDQGDQQTADNATRAEASERADDQRQVRTSAHRLR